MERRATIERATKGLQDDDPDVKLLSAHLLGLCRDPGAVGPLAAALSRENREIRFAVVNALREIKAPQTLEPLVQALRDEDGNIRAWAVWGLGDLRDRRAIEPLIGVLGDEYGLVRLQAVEALAALTGVNFKEDAAAGKEWWEKNKSRFLPEKPPAAPAPAAGE